MSKFHEIRSNDPYILLDRKVNDETSTCEIRNGRFKLALISATWCYTVKKAFSTGVNFCYVVLYDEKGRR